MASFATPTELASFIGSGPFTGTRAQEVLDYASALVRRACGGQLIAAFTGRQEEFAGSDDDMLFLTQRPVTAVSAVTVDAVAFTEFIWTRWGTVSRSDEGQWSTGPILVTYDGGYATTDDEYLAAKGICLEAAARAITKETPDLGTFGEGIPEARGWTPHLFLTLEEQERLADFGPVPVG